MMTSTSRLAARLCASAALLVSLNIATARAEDPGVAADSVTIGQTIPLSGPVSAYATFSRASSAFYDMVNANGAAGFHAAAQGVEPMLPRITPHPTNPNSCAWHRPSRHR